MYNLLGANDFRAVVNVDIEDNVLWIRTVCGTQLKMDNPEPIAIDLTIDYNEPKFKKQETVKTYEETFVNAKLAPYDQVDLIKIDAGKWTPYILEALCDVINVSKPFMFVYTDEHTDDGEVYNFLVNECGYISDPSIATEQHKLTLIYHHSSAYEEFN